MCISVVVVSIVVVSFILVVVVSMVVVSFILVVVVSMVVLGFILLAHLCSGGQQLCSSRFICPLLACLCLSA